MFWGSVVGLVVLLAGAVVLKDKIAEEYWLYKLQSGDWEERRVAAEKLVEMGWVSPKCQVVQCRGHLMGLYMAALDYSLTFGDGYFPVAGGENPRAHESFNLLLRSPAGEDMKAITFVCPAGEAIEAEVDDNEDFFLKEENVGYAWIAKPTKRTGKAVPLACCKYFHGYQDEDGKHMGHIGCINVIYTDGSLHTLAIKRDRDKLNDDYLPPGLTR